ncbi:MAG: hypothetical protein K9L95_06425 [Candidatus Omnitrophica bacterium]|nr:hypothetical protein [Candidatus Omnitrophota bacterium]MCF7888273.1 hypothetical protein [Candidatus Omnitrophota bacterium]
MRLLILVILSVFIVLSFPLYSKEQATTILEEENSKNDWANVVSQGITNVTLELGTIDEEMAQGQINTRLQRALEIVQQMRIDTKKQGIIVEGFSLSLALPPSVTIEFKFKD